MTFGSLIPVCTPAGCRYFIPCLYSSCDLKENRRGNSLPQIPHTCCIFSACAWALTLWQTKFDIWLNPLPQSSHLYGLSFVWVNTWFLKLPDNGTVFNCCRLHYLRANYLLTLCTSCFRIVIPVVRFNRSREKLHDIQMIDRKNQRINNLSNYKRFVRILNNMILKELVHSRSIDWRLPFWWNPFPQTWHLCGLCSEWVFRCEISVDTLEKKYIIN